MCVHFFECKSDFKHIDYASFIMQKQHQLACQLLSLGIMKFALSKFAQNQKPKEFLEIV